VIEMKKLTDREFFKLKKDDLVIENYNNGEFMLLMEVVGVIAGGTIIFKRIRFCPTGDISEDEENNEILSSFPEKIKISAKDAYATLFSGFYEINPHETSVTNSIVSYFKTTIEDYLCEYI